jgi:hypothetical protein
VASYSVSGDSGVVLVEMAPGYGIRGGVLRARSADHGEDADRGQRGRGGEREPPVAGRREHGVDEVDPEQQHREVESPHEEGDHSHHPDPEGGRRGHGVAGSAGHGGPPPGGRRRGRGGRAAAGEEAPEEEERGRGGGPADGEEGLSRHPVAAEVAPARQPCPRKAGGAGGWRRGRK